MEYSVQEQQNAQSFQVHTEHSMINHNLFQQRITDVKDKTQTIYVLRPQ